MKNNFVNEYNLQFDPLNKNYLLQIARWARFLSVTGFIITGILILGGCFIWPVLHSLENFRNSDYSNYTGIWGSCLIGFFYFGIAITYFFPCLYLYRFSAQMLRALQTAEQMVFNKALKQLKSSFKFVGVFTIIMLALYTLTLLLGFAVVIIKNY